MADPQATFSWWHWHFHPDIVLGMLLLEGLYLLGIGPLRKRFALASSVETRHVALFSLGMLVLYAALTGPIHELADNFLFSAHMVQHLLMILLVPRLLLAGTPGWLLRPLVRPPLILALGRFLTNPVIAFLIFTTALSVWHLPFLYDLTLRSHAAHVTEHLMFIASAVIMWWPLMSPLPELPRASYPIQIVYLFFLSLPPGFIGAAITFSRRVLYPWYDTVPRIWGLSAIADQQVGGLIMKIPGALTFMVVLVVVFFAWYKREGDSYPDQPSENQPDRLEPSHASIPKK
ncbi:MAG: cytochrome c oxidase assembly protein [Dehalococcoidia bacterium]|nr:cytochrome c oxidase assembly protein [Dehalococcoidia bacterium]